MEEAEEWKNLMKLVAGSGKGLSGIIESTKKVILASLYIRKSPTFLNKRKVCPNLFQWQKYRKAMSSIIYSLEKGDCNNCLNARSKQYIGPVEPKLGTCGEPKVLNLNGVNKIDYYPSKQCMPDSKAPLQVALESTASAGKRGARIYARITASAGAEETAAWGEANNGVALARAIRGVAEGVKDSHALVISDLDGERYRAMEWVMAQPKCMWYSETHEHWNPADCIGDSGAAMGAIMLAWGSMALRKDYARTGRALVWGASDGGLREAVMLERAGADT